jgi:hypothetical protein
MAWYLAKHKDNFTFTVQLSDRKSVNFSQSVHNLYASPHIIRGRMGGACNTHGKDEKWVQNVVGYLKERDRLVVLVVDGKTILEWILGKQGPDASGLD